MERKRLPNEVDLNALFDALDSTPEQATALDVDVFQSDVVAFLSHYNIKNGTHRVNKQLLHRLYKTWSKQKALSKPFHRQMTLYIQTETRYYLINRDPSELIVDLSFAIKDRKPPRTRNKSFRAHVDAFFRAFDVKPGGEWIEFHIINHFYDKWVYNKKKKRLLSQSTLQGFLKVLFENRTTKDGLVVKITHNFEQTSIENLRVAWKRKQRGRE